LPETSGIVSTIATSSITQLNRHLTDATITTDPVSLACVEEKEILHHFIEMLLREHAGWIFGLWSTSMTAEE